ncbi:MAG: carbamoyltransferase family protein, partial [Vicinamibacterales bacterium]
SGRQFLQSLLEEEFGCRVDPRRFHFVDHHFAHACSAYYPSGFDRTLVLTTDGVGDSLSGSLYTADDHRLELLRTFAEEDSLGFFYLDVTRYLGFDLFDEYKVMGLAPYGNGERFEPVFARLYELRPDGTYRFNRERMRRLWQDLPARPAGGELTQSDKDVAMAAQATLERIVHHVVAHAVRSTGHDRLCLAGGVALNCRMNGDLLRRGLVRQIFVQPAAHDAGLSLGAALHVHHSSQQRPAPRSRLRHVYWGGHCGSEAEIEALLRAWEVFVDWDRVPEPQAVVAKLMSEGTIVGWVHGRSEFGPRALGNRSILADPRPAVNKDVINALVKKREAFRPFAPSVLEEYAGEVFELPPGVESLPFMLVTVQVREQYREALGAITHVDGSARVQTVSRADNPCYWSMIDGFRELTGLPVLLNTSFNNFAEPIVETAADALVCFLTTGLPVLAIDDWIVRKRPRPAGALASLRLRLPVYVKLHDRPLPADGAGASLSARGQWWRRLRAHLAAWRSAPANGRVSQVGNTFDWREYEIPDTLFRILLASDGCRSVDELMDDAGVCDTGARAACIDLIEELWERRLVTLTP